MSNDRPIVAGLRETKVVANFNPFKHRIVATISNDDNTPIKRNPKTQLSRNAICPKHKVKLKKCGCLNKKKYL